MFISLLYNLKFISSFVFHFSIHFSCYQFLNNLFSSFSKQNCLKIIFFTWCNFNNFVRLITKDKVLYINMSLKIKTNLYRLKLNGIFFPSYYFVRTMMKNISLFFYTFHDQFLFHINYSP